MAHAAIVTRLKGENRERNYDIKRTYMFILVL